MLASGEPAEADGLSGAAVEVADSLLALVRAWLQEQAQLLAVRVQAQLPLVSPQRQPPLRAAEDPPPP